MTVKEWKLFYSVLLSLAVIFFFATPAAAADGRLEMSMEIINKVEGGNPEVPEKFRFIIETEEAAPLPEDNTVVIQGEGAGSSGVFVFSEPGDYHYTVRELPGSTAGYEYDDNVYHVTVQVTEDPEGVLRASVYAWEFPDDVKSSELLFVNRYIQTERKESEDTEDFPRTGDYGLAWVWIGGICLSLPGTAAVLRRIKRR